MTKISNETPTFEGEGRSLSVLKVIHRAPTTAKHQDDKPYPIDLRTFWTVHNHDSTGKALTLYLFYVQKALDQNSCQPWVIDSFCARRLRWHIKTVRKARQALQQAKVIEQIKKRRSNYIRVHYLTDKIKGKSMNMQTENIPEALMGTYMVLDYYTMWFDNMKFYKNFPRFQNDVRNGLGYSVDEQIICNKMESVWNKINEMAYPIVKVNNELSFYSYVVKCVINKFKEKN